MLERWLLDLESLEAVAQDDSARRLCLRLAAMSRAGTLESFLASLRRDGDLGDGTAGTIAEIADDERFLLALEDYVQRTKQLH